MKEKREKYESDDENSAEHTGRAVQSHSWNYAARLLPVTNANVYTEIVALLKIDCLLRGFLDKK